MIMAGEMTLLAWTAASLGFVHTLIGPDHYLPFIVLSKARGWSWHKAAMITFLCGIGHVLSSVILGFLGIALGVAVFHIEAIESFRGDVAGWLLFGLGLAYLVWGIHRAVRNQSHRHFHQHDDGESHLHVHGHFGEHTHVHDSNAANIAPWVLFIIFVFGPCEPLIPLLMYPAAQGNMVDVVLIASIFGLATIATMLSVVMASFYGISKFNLPQLGRYSHAFAGLAISMCGFAIVFIGL